MKQSVLLCKRCNGGQMCIYVESLPYLRGKIQTGYNLGAWKLLCLCTLKKYGGVWYFTAALETYDATFHSSFIFAFKFMHSPI